jgi:type II secretory pathway pseudopilin PulG
MTLLELLVAIAVMIMITALVFPELGRLRDTLLVRRTALLLVADLRHAHADAIETADGAAVTILRGGYAYRVQDGMRTMPAGLQLSGGTIKFYADGTASGGRVLLLGARRRIEISVDPALGSIAMSGL